MKSRVLRWLVCLLIAPVTALILIIIFGVLFGGGSDAASGITEPGRSIIFSKRYVIVGLAQLITSGVFAYILRGRVIPGGLVFGIVSGALTGSVMVLLMALVDYDSLSLVLANIVYTMLGVCMAYGLIGGLVGSGLYRFTHREQ